MRAVATDFFTAQEDARRRTGRLILYYGLAVAAIVASVYLAIAVFAEEGLRRGGPDALPSLWNPRLFGWVAGFTLLVIGTGTAYKILELSGGGAAVARMLGGRLVPRNTADPDERRVLNVVEEMALASGTPVPPVYLLDGEAGINAFAAGYTPRDAVIGITRGAVTRLRRDELQGVVGHEFSHVLNGDMRLNLRLIGVLHGILVLGLIGYWMFRMALSGSRGSSSRKGRGASGAFALLGLVVMAIGYIGVFFGRLIQSAVSRQREYLADASSVQYTRQPDGLAGALKKIGALDAGSRVQTAHAGEVGHLFFANGLHRAWFQALATHPPLVDRIRRLDPGFDGDFARVAVEGPVPAAPPPVPAAPPPLPAAALTATAAVATVGAPAPAHLAYAADLLRRLPDGLAALVRTPEGASASICALLLARDPGVRGRQLGFLAGRLPANTLALTRRAAGDIDALGAEFRLPLAELAAATLRELPSFSYEPFAGTVDGLIQADRAVDLFEYALRRVVGRQLDPRHAAGRAPAPSRHAVEDVREAAVDLLSCLAYWGADEAAPARAAFARGAAVLGWPAAAPRPVDGCGLPLVDRALAALAESDFAVRRKVLTACLDCVIADGRVTVEEGELLRAVSAALDCPMPPLTVGAA